MAAIGGLTMAKMAEYKAQMIANGLDDEQIANAIQKIALTYAEIGAERTANSTKKTGIALLWSKFAGYIAETAGKMASWIAQNLLNSAEATGLALTIAYVAIVLVFIAALAVLILIIWGIVTAF
jgi:hypothetical protein